jgi:hypothetical protein
MTYHASRFEDRPRGVGPSVARFLRGVAEALAGVRFIPPQEEDAELVRVERFAREALSRRAGSGPPRA